MSINFRIVIIALVLLLIDWYFYQAVAGVLKGSSASKKTIVFYLTPLSL